MPVLPGLQHGPHLESAPGLNRAHPQPCPATDTSGTSAVRQLCCLHASSLKCSPATPQISLSRCHGGSIASLDAQERALLSGPRSVAGCPQMLTYAYCDQCFTGQCWWDRLLCFTHVLVTASAACAASGQAWYLRAELRLRGLASGPLRFCPGTSLRSLLAAVFPALGCCPQHLDHAGHGAAWPRHAFRPQAHDCELSAFGLLGDRRGCAASIDNQSHYVTLPVFGAQHGEGAHSVSNK